jgi:hypothetical protein
MDPVWPPLISDLFVNLAAGWFAAALLVTTPEPLNWRLMSANMAFGIMSLFIAFLLVR